LGVLVLISFVVVVVVVVVGGGGGDGGVCNSYNFKFNRSINSKCAVF
jgi:hypothetical protein